jgi:hypothetical protein
MRGGEVTGFEGRRDWYRFRESINSKAADFFPEVFLEEFF